MVNGMLQFTGQNGRMAEILRIKFKVQDDVPEAPNGVYMLEGSDWGPREASACHVYICFFSFDYEYLRL